VSRALLGRVTRLEKVFDPGDNSADAALAKYAADGSAVMLDAGITPDPCQAVFLRSSDTMNLILCARQVGKSLAVSMLALVTALTKPGSLTAVVAQRQDQAAELLRKSVTAYFKIGAPVPLLRSGATHFQLKTVPASWPFPARSGQCTARRPTCS
jgi:hypothetical protein